MSDPCSFSRPEECLCTNITWNVSVDFASKVLVCDVELDFLVKKDNVASLVLDTRDLNVQSVAVRPSNDQLTFSLGSKHKAFGSPLKISLPPGLKSGARLSIAISYRTSPDASALQWLTPEQTSGKKHPYMFTQCQAIHARSIIPCQDSPGVKATYSAKVSVPKVLVALMSAARTGSELDHQKQDLMTYQFEQKVAIPSYLIALVVGALKGRQVGPRSHVWTEQEMVEECAYEFAEMEQMISAAESLVGEYVWGPYDLLILPPSFPYGGMENPCLTFVTPTLLAGDRSLTGVVAHEISHSWTGNLVTNSTWEHFWLNEGFTVFLERKIIGRMKGEQMRQFGFIGGWKTLMDAVSKFADNMSLTKLVVSLKDTDPDDAFSSVPYEKGSCFLVYLEQLLGGPEVFEPFFRKYIDTYKYKTCTTDEWKTFLFDYFKDKTNILETVDWEAWLRKPGMPPVNMIERYDSSLADACISLCQKWINASEKELNSFSSQDIASFTSPQKVEFLAQLLAKTSSSPLSVAHLQAMQNAYQFNSYKNSEIKFRWLRLCVRSGWADAFQPTVDFLLSQGRMKFTRPLYEELFKCEKSKDLAVTTFKKHRAFYHPICSAMVAKDLGID
ncbi:leukotriene A-4 hydrolase [Nematostella vectensis]|uniref:leukotriene A-4 hydrolase n=1 Tax=Nematostella vectensis TaxID=45351 RepID=UPI0020770CB1|nr:leukotriene A-4 hydrolase [Nematostella vectensis]